MTMDVQPGRATGGANLVLLWFGMLAAPTAWALQLTITYFVAALGCSGNVGRLEALLHLVSAVALLVSIAGLAVALFELAGLPAGAPTVAARRARWMAVAGVLLSGLFLVGVVFGDLPTFLLEDYCASAQG